MYVTPIKYVWMDSIKLDSIVFYVTKNRNVRPVILTYQVIVFHAQKIWTKK